jgi:hypothetical protein
MLTLCKTTVLGAAFLHGVAIAANADGMDASGDANSDFCATLLAMASGDLRQPLPVIVSAHGMLARIPHSGAAQAQLARAEDATRQLADKAYG